MGMGSLSVLRKAARVAGIVARDGGTAALTRVPELVGGGGFGGASARAIRAAGESPIGSPHSRHRSEPSSTSA
jgi:hypothetical protein